jgi:hypothetical protein
MTGPRSPGHSWRQNIDSGGLLLIAAGVLLLLGAGARTAEIGVVRPHAALVFGAGIAVGEMLRLRLPAGREVAPIASAGALAYAMLLSVGNTPADQSALQVIAVTAVAMVIGALPHLAAGRPAGLVDMASRLIAIAVVAMTFRPEVVRELRGSPWWVALAVMAGLLVLWWWTECLIRALARAGSLRARFGVALRDEMRVQLPLGVAVAATAVLVDFAAQSMGLIALAVFVAPLLATQLAFRRYAGIRATYLQTIRALARVTEVGGYVEHGHADRVGELAVAVGRELGMRESDLVDLEYAALMHDIGQLSLAEPIPGGATVLVSPANQRRIAELGAEVIEQTGVLDRVAEIVRCQDQPWRGSAEPPMGSRVIRAANAYDDMVGDSADTTRAMAALERLRLDTATEYDPAVVEALSKVTARRRVSHR